MRVNGLNRLSITEALKGMEKVAEHINEMQRIHEEYGAIFEHLFRQHQKSCKQVRNVSIYFVSPFHAKPTNYHVPTANRFKSR